MEEITLLGPSRAPLALALALALPSCQSYEPRPLDLDAHRSQWRARLVETGSLATFLAEMDHAGGAGRVTLEDGLDLEEARLVARVYHPDLRLARLHAARAAAGARHAGALADPELVFELLRIDGGVPTPWFVAPSLSFRIPLGGRLAAEGRVAEAETRAALETLREEEWRVDGELEAAWIAWSTARLRAEETERFAGRLDELVRSTALLAETGELARTEAALFEVERAQRGNELIALEGAAREAELTVRALLGLAPHAPIALTPSLGAATDDTDTDEDELAARNPRLARLRREYDVAEEQLRREVAEQWPDLVLGPAYESDAGQSRIGFVGALPLPVFDANRRGIAEARAERELARAAFETEYERLAGHWSAARSRVETADRRRTHMETVLVPLVDAQLEAAENLVELGEGAALLLESLSRAYETRLAWIDVRASGAAARAELAHLRGPDPSPTETTEVDR